MVEQRVGRGKRSQNGASGEEEGGGGDLLGRSSDPGTGSRRARGSWTAAYTTPQAYLACIIGGGCTGSRQRQRQRLWRCCRCFLAAFGGVRVRARCYSSNCELGGGGGSEEEQVEDEEEQEQQEGFARYCFVFLSIRQDDG